MSRFARRLFQRVNEVEQRRRRAAADIYDAIGEPPRERKADEAGSAGYKYVRGSPWL
jgi:hypothetical protein